MIKIVLMRAMYHGRMKVHGRRRERVGPVISILNAIPRIPRGQEERFKSSNGRCAPSSYVCAYYPIAMESIGSLDHPFSLPFLLFFGNSK